MFKRWLICFVACLGLFVSGPVHALKQKKYAAKQAIAASKKKKVSQVSKQKKSANHKKSRSSKKKKPAASSRRKHATKHKTYSKQQSIITIPSTTKPNLSNEKVVSAPLQLIAQNKEKSRITDSVHKSIMVSAANLEDEGYFSSLFSSQKKTASIQTLEGTAAVFKSLSGWQDKKFYILTNQLPVGTVVRITTSDLKSICAKVINSLPEVGSAVQYRLNDAAAAILGITNKTFQISVTY